MRLKKLVLTAMVSILGAFVLTGCGNSGGAGTDRSAESTTEMTKKDAANGEAAGGEGSVETLKVGRIGNDIKIAPIIIASEQGYYEEEGVNVEFENIDSLPDGLTAVSQEKLDILPFGVIPSATYISQGVDVVVFGGTISEGSECITTEANKDAFTDAESFRGKKVGCFRMETGHMVIKNYLQKAGLSLDKDVEFVYLESQAAIMEAVKKGEVDCGFVNSGYGYVCQQSGLFVAFRPGEWVENFPCCRQTTNRNAIENKKDTLVKYMIANLRGYAAILNEKESAIASLCNYSGQDAAYVENVIYGSDTYTAAMKISLDPCKNAVCDFYQDMKDIGDIDAETTYDIKDYISTDIYEEALQTMIEREPENTLWTDLMTEFKNNNQ